MTLGDISDKFGLTDNERASFAEYAANRFANAVKLGEPDMVSDRRVQGNEPVGAHRVYVHGGS